MDMLLNSILAQVGMGAGLSGLAGIRAFLPLALAGLFARYDLLGGALQLDGTSFAFLENPWVIGALFALAVAEMAVDKIPLVDTAQDLVATPVRVIAGAILFGAALSEHGTGGVVAGMLAGAGVSGVSHGVKGAIRPGATIVSEGSVNPFLSLFEDVTVTLGSVILLIVPFLGILALLLLFYLTYRLERRRRRKYKGLRVLRE